MIKDLLLSKKSDIYKSYQTAFSDEVHLNSLAQINLFVGQNNTGKSRLIREIFKDLINIEVYNPSSTKSNYNNYEDLYGKKNIETFHLSKSDFLEEFKQEIDDIYNYFGQQPITKWLTKVIEELGDVITSSKIETIYRDAKHYFFLGIERYFDEKTAVRSITVELSNPQGKHFSREEVTKICSSFINKLETKLPFNYLQGATYTYIPSFRTLRKYEILSNTENSISIPFPQKTNLNSEDLQRVEKPILKLRALLDYFTIPRDKKDHSTLMLKKEKEQINLNVKPSCIFSGEELYDIIKNLRNSPLPQRRILTDFESFLSKIYFNGQNIELHSLEVENIKDVYVRLEEKEFPIFNLGDGIQSIIILTFPLFLHREKRHVVFIEEPELFLHPGMQRVFMETLIKFPTTQCFIATHSNHFLDLSLEYPELISIFSLKHSNTNTEKHHFQIEQFSGPSTSLLLNLGVRNSSVFLSNCTIWLEGISDRLFISKYLELYLEKNPDKMDLKKLKLDLHYSFIEYNGNNIVHWNFNETHKSDSSTINATKIANKIFLIHDKDTNKEKRHHDLKLQLAENYFPLPCLEIENLLSPLILRNVLSKFYSKNNTQITFKDFKQEDYINYPIAEFICEMTDESKLKKFITKSTETTTRKVYNKAEFARNSVSQLNDWDDLSPQAQVLTRAVYKFISENNQ